MDTIARDKILHDLEKNYFIEAGAGTGKTTLLVGRIFNILATGKATLPQVVAITFTEKAGQELTSRIKEILEQNILQNTWDHLTTLRLQQAILDLEHAEITTIHGFCSSILRDYALLADVPLGMDVMAEPSSEMLYQQVWEEWLLQKFQEQNEFLMEAIRLGFHPDQFYDIACLIHVHRDCLENFQPKLEVISAIALQQWLGDEIVFLESVLPSCKNHEDRGYKRLCILLSEWRFLISLDEKEWLRKAILGLNVKVEGNKKNWDPPTNLEAIKERLQNIKGELEQFSRLAKHNLLQHCVRWVQDFLVYYQQEKYNRKVLDFEDLLICTRNLIKQNVSVRKELQEKYEFILVDEFQDTDPLQVEILFFLAEKKDSTAMDWKKVELEPGKFFAVGDPKQAIYRFRRADIEMVEEVKERLGKDSYLAIVQNFRSCSGVIDWTNHAFSHLIQETGSYQPKYIPLYASRGKSSQGYSVYSLHIPKPPDEDKVAIKEIVEQESQAIANMIQRMVNEKWMIQTKTEQRPMVYSDVAILLRRFTYIDSFEQALTRANIPCQIIGSKSFYSRIEIRSLISLLKAILEPYNAIAVVAVLKSPIFCIAEQDILQHFHTYQTYNYRDCIKMNPEEVLTPIFAVLRELYDESRYLNMPQFLEKIFAKTGLLFTFLYFPQGEQRVANLHKVRELAYNFMRMGIRDIASFVQWIYKLATEEQEESESYLQDSMIPSVKIISIHRSKGLEFPVVCLGDLGVTRNQNPDIVLERNSHELELRLQGKIELKTLGYDEAVLLEKEKNIAEEKRLLYVASTRARDYLIIPNIATDRGYGLWLAPFLGDSEVCQSCWIQDNPNHSNPISLTSIPTPSNDANVGTTVEKNWEESFLAWKQQRRQIKVHPLLSCQKVLAPFLPQPSDMILQAKIDAYHRAMEDILAIVLPSFPKLLPKKELSQKLVTIVESVCLRYPVLGNAETQKVSDMIVSILTSSLFCRIYQSNGYQASVPFFWKMPSHEIYGQIPLLFWEKNNYSVVLYKAEPIPSEQVNKMSTWYRWEANFYALLLKQTSSVGVREVILYFLHANRLIAINPTQENMSKVLDMLQKSTF